MASCYYYCSYPASSFDPTDLDTEQWAQTGRYYCTALAPTHSVCQGHWRAQTLYHLYQTHLQPLLFMLI